MNTRRSFFKGLFATAAIVATGKLVAASEMLGNAFPVVAPKLSGIDIMLVEESGWIGTEIYRKMMASSPWTALVKSQAWPENFGDTLQRLPTTPDQLS